MGSFRRVATFVPFLVLTGRWAITQDCNGSEGNDAADVLSGYSKDCDENGLPDECDLLPEREYTHPSRILAARRPQAIAALDLDADGDLDLVTANAASGNLSLIRNDGAGGLLRTEQVESGAEPMALATGDLDGDLDVDIAVANEGSGTIGIFLNGADGSLSRAADLEARERPLAVVIANFDGDGRPDIAAALFGSRALRVWTGMESGGFAAAGDDLPLERWPTAIAAPDFAGDGLADLAATVYGDVSGRGDDGEHLHLFQNQGGANFLPADRHDLTQRAVGLTAGDLDADGLAELIVGAQSRPMLFWALPEGGFSGETLELPEWYAVGAGTGDLDGDGSVDLVLPGNRLGTLLNGGDRTFGTGPWLQMERNPSAAVAADLDGDGQAEIAVAETGTCCTWEASSVTLVRQEASGSLALADVVPYNEDLRRLASADFDGDGLRDLAAATSGGIVSVLLQASGLRFPRALRHPAGAELTSIAALDADHDSRPDLVTGRQGDAALSLFTNLGDGGLSAPRTIPLSVEVAFGMAAGDLDADGDLDLVVCDNWENVLCLELAGPGEFREARRLLMPGRPSGAAVLDLDRDGKADIVVETSGDARLLWGEGDFAFRVEVMSFALPRHLASELHDLDGDGRLDLIYGQPGGTRVVRQLAYGQLSPRFGNTWHRQLTSAVAAGDFSGTGRGEIAVGGPDPMTTIAFLEATSPARALDLNGNAIPDLCDLAIGDCNGNGTLDLEEVAAGLAPDCDENGVPDECDLRPALALAPLVTFPIAGTNPYSVAAADLDADGDVDVAAANSTSSDFSVLLNQENSTFAPEVRHPIPSGSAVTAESRVILAVDFDGDGDTDLATQNGRYRGDTSDTTATVFANGGDGTFGLLETLVTGASTRDLVAGDLNGDGHPDLLTAVENPDEADLFLNSPAGFGSGTKLALPFDTGAKFVRVGDLDGDGDAEIIAGGRRLGILRNRGDGAFEIGSDSRLDPYAESGALGDLDRDGDLDLALGHWLASQVTFHLNDGLGQLLPGERSLPTARPLRTLLADVDGDADLDLLAVQAETQAITVRLNAGEGSFGAPREFAAGRIPLAAALGDLDANGFPDVIVGIGEDSPGDDGIGVLLNYSGWSRDCDANGSPDACDIAAGHLPDEDGDGIADACLRRLNFSREVEERTFRRGDPNDDGRADISDALTSLRYLFQGTATPRCLEAADFDNDGTVNITDPIAHLGFLFQGGPPPAAPGPPPGPCGPDPDGAGSPGNLGCSLSTRC